MTSKELLDATMHLEMKYLDEADARADAVIPAARKKSFVIAVCLPML